MNQCGRNCEFIREFIRLKLRRLYSMFLGSSFSEEWEGELLKSYITRSGLRRTSPA